VAFAYRLSPCLYSYPHAKLLYIVVSGSIIVLTSCFLNLGAAWAFAV